MKLKASAKKLNINLLFIIFAVEGLIFTAIRFYQMSALTDAESGFFTDKSNITVPIYYILWVATVIGSFILFYICPGTETGTYAPRRNIPLAAGSLLMGVTAVIKALSDLSQMQTKAAGLPLIDYIRTEKEFLAFGAILFGLMAAVVFSADAIALLTNKDVFHKVKIAHLCPILWLFCIIVTYFSLSVSYLNTTQLMLAMFSDGFLCVFIYEYAKFLTGTQSDEAPWLLYATGIISEIFICACTLPNLFFTITGRYDMLVENCPMNYYDAAAIIFIPCVLFSAATNKNHKVISIAPIEAQAEGNEKESE